MIKKIIRFCAITLACVVTASFLLAQPGAQPFKERIREYINAHDSASQPAAADEKAPDAPAAASESGLGWSDGDWQNYILTPSYLPLLQGRDLGRTDDSIDVVTYGSMRLNLGYGASYFTNSKYRTSDQDKPVSRVITPGFTPEQELLLHMEGRIGRRVTVYIDHDSRRKDNYYQMQYRAVEEDEVIREINAGDIDIKFNKSKYAVYDNSSAKGLGVDMTLRKDRLQVKAFGSVMQGEIGVEHFKGNSSSGNVKLQDYSYVHRIYYQLEPFRRYDNLGSPPADATAVYSSRVMTSAGSDTLYPVNISSSGFEIYMDDQDPLNNYGGTTLSIDGGYYRKLSSGSDYTINFETGVITLLREVSARARIYVLYSLASGTTSDPCVLAPGETGNPSSDKYFTFIRYGYSLNEDTAGKDLVSEGDRNGDGKVNLDIYEIRSYYSIGEKSILQDGFHLVFYYQNRVLSTTEISLLGGYSIDYNSGIIRFNRREPFKKLLTGSDSAIVDTIYCENQGSTAQNNTRYRMGLDYYRDRRTFQLQHGNVIPGSVRIKINNREISPTLYTLDAVSGYISFPNADSPSITSETEIEIRYQYYPLGTQSGAFVGGVRTDYTFNRYLSVGGSALFTRNGTTDVIPTIENAPSSTTVFEGDASLYMDGKKLADIARDLSGKRTGVMPVELRSYVEYARSYRQTNTFGKGLVDSMDTGDQVTELPMSEKSWQLGSLPLGSAQTDRGLLYYRYYRNSSDPGELKGLTYSPAKVAYGTKPGPYNVATGHYADGVVKSSDQLSLVFDYDFTAGSIVSVAGSKFSGGKIDLSAMQYVEISCMLEAEEGSGTVDFALDVGHLNEDADGDGFLETEDTNNNGELDYSTDYLYSEDKGYIFHGNNPTVVGSGPCLSSVTRGDGVLNTEDLDGNGTLDTAASEEVYTKSVSVTSGTWQILRIYVDGKTLTSAETDLLSRVESIRLSLKKGSSTKGKLFVDHIRFVSSSWKDVSSGTSVAKVTMVNSLNDADYRADAFIFSRKDVYQSLYGKRSSQDLLVESESALRVEYSMSASIPAVIEKRFSRTMDMRFYKSLVVWLNPRSFGTGDYVDILVGSSDTDTVTYRVTPAAMALWQEVKLYKAGENSGGYEPVAASGDIDYRRISIIRFTFSGASAGVGEMWVNDIYAAEAVTLKDSAHWFENEMKVTKPFYKTAGGTPVFSNMTLRYLTRGNGEDFNSVGKVTTGTSEKVHQVYTSCDILPSWKASADFFQDKTETDSDNTDVVEDQRGSVIKRSFVMSTDYQSSGVAPSVKLGYRLDTYEGDRQDRISSARVQTSRGYISHIPSIDLRENLAGILGGSIQGICSMNLLFRRERETRESSDMDQATLSTVAGIDDREKRQKSDATLSLRYYNRLFFIKPEISASSEEIIEATGQNCSELNLENEVKGGYHIPFVYSGDMRFLLRNHKASFSTGWTQLNWLRPEYRMEFTSTESGFRDYTTDERTLSGIFSRERNALSSLGSTITIPFGPGIAGKWDFFKNLNLVYRRNVSLEESEIPYEGEGTNQFDEQYGVRRILAGLSGAAYNLFRYPPGYFLTGRKTSARARDYARSTLNDSILFYQGTSTGYNNTLKVLDDVSVLSTIDFNRFNLSTGCGINVLSERNGLDGVPGEVVTRYGNVRFSFNLMKIFSFWFFRPNIPDMPYHSATADLSYEFNRLDIITSAIREDRHIPGTGITFKWDRSSLGFTTSVEYRLRRAHDYIDRNYYNRSRSDDLYIENMADQTKLRERETGYNFSTIYETDVPWIYNFFLEWYQLTARPVFTLKYTLALNRYNYRETVSPEPYDLHRFDSGLTMDLHRNVQGGISGTLALERYHNRDTGAVIREIISYGINFNFTLIF